MRYKMQNTKIDEERIGDVIFTASFNGYRHDIKQWQQNYFDLLTLKNVWNYFDSMSMEADGDNIFLRIVCTRGSADYVRNFLDVHGYENYYELEV